MLRVPLVTLLALEMRLKIFEVDQALEMLRVPLVTILAREMRLNLFWSRPTFGDVASAARHDIGARNAIEIFWSRPTVGDVVSAASHDIGTRNAIESFFKLLVYILCQTANNVTSRARKISRKFVEKMSIFNRINRANIMTSGPRSTSKACFVEKLSITFLAPTTWLAALAPHSLRGLHVSIAYPAPISWQKRPCSQSHVKHVSDSTAMALKASDRRHHAVEFIRNPASSYFHSQVFIFMRLSSLALPWIALLARKCDCHAMVNSLAIARIAISTRNLQLSSLRLYGHFGLPPSSVHRITGLGGSVLQATVLRALSYPERFAAPCVTSLQGITGAQAQGRLSIVGLPQDILCWLLQPTASLTTEGRIVTHAFLSRHLANTRS